MQKIIWIFPDIEVEYWFASEDVGSSGTATTGSRKKRHSKRERTRPSQTYEFWFDVWGGMPDYIRYNAATDNYEHLSERIRLLEEIFISGSIIEYNNQN